MRLVLSTTIVKDNIEGLPDVIEFARSRGLYGVNFQPIMPATTLPVFNKEGQTVKFSVGSPYRDLLKQKENAVVDDVFARLQAMKERGYPILNSSRHLTQIAKYLKDPTSPELLKDVCKVGVRNVNIDPFGNVRLCSIMDSIGNIVGESPADLWRSANAAEERHKIRTCDKGCRLMFCNYKELDFAFRAKRVMSALTAR
jgi:MoaA/NifB/PqqE/SkfB family radical SAM enzyme